MLKHIKDVHIAGPPPKAKRVKPYITDYDKAEYVCKRTNLEVHFNAQLELEKDLISPTLSEIGTDDESEEEIHEHIDEILPTKKERYATVGPAIWLNNGYKQTEKRQW